MDGNGAKQEPEFTILTWGDNGSVQFQYDTDSLPPHHILRKGEVFHELRIRLIQGDRGKRMTLNVNSEVQRSMDQDFLGKVTL